MVLLKNAKQIMFEIWKDIVRYEGLYQISNFGRVKRIISASGTHSGRILSPFTDRQKYLVVTLCNTFGHRKFYVHRLVIEVFIGPYPEGHECRHLDGNRQNNRLHNLATGTHKDNVGDAIRHGTHTALNQYGCDNPLARLDTNHILEIRNLYENDKISQKDLAIRFGVCQATINQIVNRKTWRHI